MTELLDRAPTASPDTVLAALELDRLRTVPLAEVLSAAALQTRVDRKYLLEADTALRVLEELRGTHHVLAIDGRRATTYASLYYDTGDWAAFRAHAQGRRRRWKVRTRLYREDGLCRLELKTKRGEATVKDAFDVPAEGFGALTSADRATLAGALAARDVAVDVGTLRPGVEIDYVRATLADLYEGTRLTIDGGLVGRLGSRQVRLRDDRVLVETKGTRRPGGADLVLRAHGVRPVSVSKYGLALSMLEPSLPGHRWRRTAGEHFRPALSPGRSAAS